MFKRILGVKNVHQTEIAYVKNKNVESNVQKLNRIKREREYPQNI